MKSTMTDDTWIDLFIIELRLRRVPGSAIGDAVASVRELLTDSGQSAEEAFGSAREYATSLELPVMNARQQALKTVFLPVLSLFAFLVLALASTAWFNDEVVLVSVPQALLLAVPVLLVVLSVIGRIVTVRSHDDDEIVEPLQARDEPRQRRGRHMFLLLVDWLFPILAVVIFAMTWGVSLLRP